MSKAINTGDNVSILDNENKLIAQGSVQQCTTLGTYVEGKEPYPFREWFPYASDKLRMQHAS